MRASSVDSAILETLNCEQCHLTAKDILDAIRPRLPAVNPSTVYRALERLVNAGNVSVSDIGQGAVVYELVQGAPHHHLVCQECGGIVTADRTLVEAFLHKVAQESGFQVATNHLILFGTCETCQNRQA